MIKISDVRISYGNDNIIKGVDLEAISGECLYIVGANGSGKTTLLKALAGLKEYSGSIKIFDSESREMKARDMAKKTALVMQTNEVYMPYSVYEAVSFGRYAHLKGTFTQLNSEDKKIIERAMKETGIWSIRSKLTTELSGGQLQRVNLARAFAQDTPIIILDEPTNHLDLKYQIELLGHLKKWVRHENRCVMGVLHDINLVRSYADRVALLVDGAILACGKPEEVLTEENLKGCFDVNITKFMRESLLLWN